MNEHIGFALSMVASDASAMALSGDELSLPQITTYIVAALLGGGAAWKVLPILVARFAVSLAGAKSEKDIIERLEKQRDNALAEADQSRKWANEAYKERNDILRELGDVKAELARVTERTEAQAKTMQHQTALIEQLTNELRGLKEALHEKAI